MRNIHLLFWQRLRSDWRFQFSIFKMVIEDWVVALYIVVPGLALFLHTYRGWWLEPPTLFHYLPLETLLPIVVIFCWSSTLRIFVEEADQLFLYQHTSWHKGIVTYSVIYNILFSLLSTLILAFLIAPFTLGFHQIPLSSFQGLFFWAFLLKVIANLLKQSLQHRFEGWRFFLAQIPFLLVISYILKLGVDSLKALDPTTGLIPWSTIDLIPGLPHWLSSPLTLILLAVLILLVLYRITLKRTLLKDISLAQTDKMKFANVILMYSGNYAKKQVRLRKHPWLFRKSGIIFKDRTPEKILTEMGLKAFLRHRSNMFFYFQVISIYGLFISVIPTLWQWIIWGISVFFLPSLAKLYWLEMINSPFVSLFSINEENRKKAGGQFIFYLISPGVFILGLVSTISSQQWLLGLVLIPVGIFIGRATAKKFAT